MGTTVKPLSPATGVAADEVSATFSVVGLAASPSAEQWRKLIRFMDAFNTFAVTILPIALGYHFAHYFISFIVQVQYLAATIADPLAKGWNLFGLGRLTVTVGFLNSMESVRQILLTIVFAIISSHVLSVIMAHRLAARFCNTRRDLLLIQCGLSLLMIIYTIFGLWLLSTPRGA